MPDLRKESDYNSNRTHKDTIPIQSQDLQPYIALSRHVASPISSAHHTCQKKILLFWVEPKLITSTGKIEKPPRNAVSITAGRPNSMINSRFFFFFPNELTHCLHRPTTNRFHYRTLQNHGPRLRLHYLSLHTDNESIKFDRSECDNELSNGG